MAGGPRHKPKPTSLSTDYNPRPGPLPPWQGCYRHPPPFVMSPWMAAILTVPGRAIAALSAAWVVGRPKALFSAHCSRRDYRPSLLLLHGPGPDEPHRPHPPVTTLLWYDQPRRTIHRLLLRLPLRSPPASPRSHPMGAGDTYTLHCTRPSSAPQSGALSWTSPTLGWSLPTKTTSSLRSRLRHRRALVPMRPFIRSA